MAYKVDSGFRGLRCKGVGFRLKGFRGLGFMQVLGLSLRIKGSWLHTGLTG